MVQVGRWIAIFFGLLGGLISLWELFRTTIGFPADERGLSIALGASTQVTAAERMGRDIGALLFGAVFWLLVWGVFRWRPWGRKLLITLMSIVSIILILATTVQGKVSAAIPTLVIAGFLLTWSFLPKVKAEFAKRGKPQSPPEATAA